MKRVLAENWSFYGVKPDGSILGPLKATVPGHIHTDLMRHGVIPDQFWRDTTQEYQWVEQSQFVYECEFDYAKPESKGAEYLVFEGIDTVSSIFLNGKLLGNTADMHSAYEFAVDEFMLDGRNSLRVDIMSIPSYLVGKDMKKYLSAFSEDRVYVRRMQCTFGWDWVPRMISYGIWKQVYLVSKAKGYIENIYVRTVDIHTQFAALEWEAEVSHSRYGSIVSVEIRDAENVIVFAGEAVTSGGFARGAMAIEYARLWWPNGFGEPTLYTFTARMNGNERSCRFGIRTAEVEEIPDSTGASFTVKINGERIFAKGANWVPADPFPSSVSKEKYDHLIQLMRDGNMNMLRVWGGGTYERSEFWDACDRLGIMVSLDFMMACAAYPEDQEWFMDLMRREATANVKELRNHPSLIFYSGDNELAMNNDADDDYSGKRMSALVTKPVTQHLDPSRAYFPTSPYRGSPFNSPTHGDCHISAWYDPAYIGNTDMRDYRKKIDACYGRFLSECAVAGSPPMSTLLKFMTKEDISAEDGTMWEFHTRNNPYSGYPSVTHYRMIENGAYKLFGPWKNIDEKVRRMEYVQYEFARLQMENCRRRKFTSSGLLYWMYNDCWPAAGWSLVDYYGQPKAGYFGAKKACSPILVSLIDEGSGIAVWLVNDTLSNQQCSIEVVSMTMLNETLFRTEILTESRANNAAVVARYSKQDLGIISREDRSFLYACVMNGNDIMSDSAFFDCMPFEFKLLPANVKSAWTPIDEYTGELKLISNRFARIVTIEGEFSLSDNYFDLMPGRSKTVKYSALTGGSITDMPIITWENK